MATTKPERLAHHLEEALRLAREIQVEARERNAWPAAGTAGHIAESIAPSDDPEAGLVASARALAGVGGPEGEDPAPVATALALVRERLEVNGLAETVRGMALLFRRDPAARKAFETVVERMPDPGA